MPLIRNGVFGALAVSLMLGAVQLACGHDLAGGRQIDAGAPPQAGINRAAKADRATAPVSASSRSTRTIRLRLDSLADMSVLIRVHVEETRARPAAPASAKPGKTAVACEPVVSMLTEAAKLLPPGRCVT